MGLRPQPRWALDKLGQTALLAHQGERFSEHPRRQSVDDGIERGIQREHHDHEHFRVAQVDPVLPGRLAQCHHGDREPAGEVAKHYEAHPYCDIALVRPRRVHWGPGLPVAEDVASDHCVAGCDDEGGEPREDEHKVNVSGVNGARTVEGQTQGGFAVAAHVSDGQSSHDDCERPAQSHQDCGQFQGHPLEGEHVHDAVHALQGYEHEGRYGHRYRRHGAKAGEIASAAGLPRCTLSEKRTGRTVVRSQVLHSDGNKVHPHEKVSNGEVEVEEVHHL